MYRLQTPPADGFRLEWFSDGRKLAEVSLGEHDHDHGHHHELELVLGHGRDDARALGTLQSFVDDVGTIRGRVSLREPVELRLTLLRPAALATASPEALRLALTPGDGPAATGAATTPVPDADRGGRPTLVSVVADFGIAPEPADAPDSLRATSAHHSAPHPTTAPRTAPRTAPPFLRFAVSGVTAPRLTSAADSRVSLALGRGEYFFELRASATADGAAEVRPLNRRTHYLARPAAGA